MKIAFLITCEHASNHIPTEFRNLEIPKEILNSHYGFDLGAYELAKALYKSIPKKEKIFLYSKMSRLLIDFNRSLENPQIFSKYTRNLNLKQKKKLLREYENFRKSSYNFIIKYINKNYLIIHLSIHSFTPVYKNKVRKNEIGILYDPKREIEKNFAKKLKKNLNYYKCYLNLPYRGFTDGHISKLRKIFKKNYLGLELEISQKILKNGLIKLKIEKDLIKAILNTSSDWFGNNNF